MIFKTYCLAAVVLSLLVALSCVSHVVAAPAPEFPLKVSDNGRYLVDQKGNPFLVTGDSPWSLLVQVDAKEMDIYLRDRQLRGFNSIIVNLIEHKFCTAPPRIRAGLVPFHKAGDFSTPNDSYFDFAHRMIEKAGEYGIVVWLAPAYLGYGGGDEGFFREIKAGGREKLRTYGKFVGRRFRDLRNIVWMLGGDYTPEKSDQWTVTDLAEAIREEDPTHLMTAHHSPGGSAAAAFGEQEWMAINNVYSYEKTLFRPMLEEYDRKPVRPFVLLESTYEGEHDSTPDQIRRQAYWAVLSGACGQFFGNNPIWHFDGPGLYPAKMTWQQALDAAGSREISLLHRLFCELPWHELVPEDQHAVLVEGYGSNGTRALTSCTADRKLSVTYIPSTDAQGRELAVAAGRFAGSVEARWYNPVSGQAVKVQGSPFANTSTLHLHTPGDNGTRTSDWLLILDAR